MAAPAVAAVAKKVAAYVLTDKKALKVVGGIVCGIIVIIIMPIIALLGIFTGGVEIDTNRLYEMIQEERTATVEKWSVVEAAMIDAGFDSTRIEEAQTIFVFALYDYVDDEGFNDKFIGCFEVEQTDAELIANINSAFGTNLQVEDFQNTMASTRNAFIQTADYVDPTTKNNIDLAKWAEFAVTKGWGYVWGTYGTVLDNSFLESKIAQYPDEVGGKEEYIRENWLGKRTADCVGLIKGYSWYDVASQTTILVSNGMPDIGADTMYENATEKGTIDTIPEIPGLAVWHEGHIGVYIGNGEVVHAANTNAGVIRTPIGDSGWTHWLKIPYISYIEQEEES